MSGGRPAVLTHRAHPRQVSWPGADSYFTFRHLLPSKKRFANSHVPCGAARADHHFDRDFEPLLCAEGVDETGNNPRPFPQCPQWISTAVLGELFDLMLRSMRTPRALISTGSPAYQGLIESHCSMSDRPARPFRRSKWHRLSPSPRPTKPGIVMNSEIMTYCDDRLRAVVGGAWSPV